MSKPKYRIKSNSPLKFGLFTGSHAAALQNVTCNNQYMKYPVFVGVRKNQGQGFTESFYVGQKWMCYLFSKLK